MDAYQIRFSHRRGQHIRRYLDTSSTCTVGPSISSRFPVALDGPKVPYDAFSMPNRLGPFSKDPWNAEDDIEVEAEVVASSADDTGDVSAEASALGIGGRGASEYIDVDLEVAECSDVSTV